MSAPAGSALPASAGTALGVAVGAAGLAWDPGAPAADAKRVAVLVVAAAALAVAVARGGGVRRAGAVVRAGAMAALGFVAWSASSLVWGTPEGLRQLGTLVAAAALGVAAASAGAVAARRSAEVASVVLGAGAGAWAVGAAALGGRGMELHGGQGNPNWLGLLMAVALPCTVGVAARALQRWRGGEGHAALAALAAGVVGVELAALALSGSRVAQIATCVALLVALGARRRVAAAAVLLFVVTALARTGAATTPPRSIEPDPTLVADAARSFHGRVWIWRTTLAAVSERPLAGTGLGGFAHAFLDTQGPRLVPHGPTGAERRFVNATTAHSDWLQALLETGLVGLLLLVVAVGAALFACLRARFMAGAAAFVAFAVCALGDSPLCQPAIAALVGLLFGAAVAAEQRLRGVRATPLALLVAAALLLATSVATWLGARLLFASRDAEPLARVGVLERAASIDPRSGEIALALGLARQELGDPPAALEALRRSRTLFANLGTDLAIGNAELGFGRPEAALTAFRRALQRHPGYFRAHANAALVLARLARFEEAEEELRIAKLLQPGHPKLEEIRQEVARRRADAETGVP